MTEQDAKVWIPQREPFVFVDKVAEVNAESAVTRYVVKAECPLVSDCVLSLAGLMENAAQTCAVRAGWMQKQQGQAVKKGYIGAVKKMEVMRFPKVGEALLTEAKKIEEVMNISLIECTTRVGEEVVATSTLKLATIDE